MLDARAAADGVRAEGMELVLSLRQISDALREGAERLLADIEAVHARMVGELEAADPVQPASGRDEALEVPEFVSRG